jgi:hypothetical protein
VLADNRKTDVVQKNPSKLLGHSRGIKPLTVLPAFSGPVRGRLPGAAARSTQAQPGSPGMLGMRESTGRQTVQILFE